MNFNRREFLKGGLAALGFMALDGLPVYAALLAVAGNHEWQNDWSFLGDLYPDPAVFKENVLTEDFPRLFEKGWDLKYEECWHKEIKGYHFFGKQWGVDDGKFGKFVKDEASRSL